MDWTLADIRAKVRKLTGRPSTQQLSNSDLDEYINQFYQNEMPVLTASEDLIYWWTMETTDGTGEYALDADMIAPDQPLWIDTGDGYERVWFTDDALLFFANYPPASNDEADEEGEPIAALLYAGELYLRPVPNDAYDVKLPVKGRPQALSETSDTPVDGRWGPAIAIGASMEIKVDEGDTEGAGELAPVLNTKINQCTAKDIMKNVNKRAAPTY